jgi:hypothetical protein
MGWRSPFAIQSRCSLKISLRHYRKGLYWPVWQIVEEYLREGGSDDIHGLFPVVRVLCFVIGSGKHWEPPR